MFNVNWYANSKQSWLNTATTNGIGVTIQWPVLTLNETAPTNTAIRSLQSVMACDVKGRKRMRIRAPTARIVDWNDMLQTYTHIHRQICVQEPAQRANIGTTGTQ